MKRIFLSALAFFLISWGGDSFASISVLGELARNFVVTPGGAYEGTVLIQNRGDKPQEVKIDKKDYVFYRDGSNKFDDPPSHPRSNASWISVSPSRVTLQPGETVYVNFKIRVPGFNDLNGSFWSVLMVEPVEPINPQDLFKPQDEKIIMNLKVVIKHAIQIITDFENTGITRIKFLDRKIVKKEEKKFLEVDIENTGERWVSPQIWAEIFDQDGKSLGRFEGTKARIFPTCSVKFHIPIDNIPKGKYKALLVADGGHERVFGTRMSFEIE